MRLLAILLLTTVPALAHGAPGPEWRLGGGIWANGPTTLPDAMSLGVHADVSRGVGAGPFFLLARGGWALASEANQSWEIDHHLGELSAGGGAQVHAGRGRFFAQAGAGLSLGVQNARRHQHLRLEGLGMPTRRGGWSLGPLVFAELGVAVRFAGDWALQTGAGPMLTAHRIEGATEPRWSLAVRMGIARAF